MDGPRGYLRLTGAAPFCRRWVDRQSNTRIRLRRGSANPPQNSKVRRRLSPAVPGPQRAVAKATKASRAAVFRFCLRHITYHFRPTEATGTGLSNRDGRSRLLQMATLQSALIFCPVPKPEAGYVATSLYHHAEIIPFSCPSPSPCLRLMSTAYWPAPVLSYGQAEPG